jgi:KaiC/GvpD/RAD55 family RecA-like ATPase
VGEPKTLDDYGDEEEARRAQEGKNREPKAKVAARWNELPTLDDVLSSMAPPGERLATGFLPTLDRVSRGGLAYGSVYVFLGPPGAGKTVLLCQLARRFAEEYGALVICFFFDEGAWQAALMMTEGLGFERRELENDYESVRAKVKPRTAPLEIRLPRPSDSDTVLDSVDRWLTGVDVTERRIVFVIDGVQTARVSKDDHWATQREHVNAVMSKVRALAQQYRAVALISSKANRASWSHKNPADNLDALAGGLGSSDIEYQSDALFSLSGDMSSSIFLHVIRNRPGDGTKPKIALGFDRDRASFSETDSTIASEEAEYREEHRREAQMAAVKKDILQFLRKKPRQTGRVIRQNVRARPELIGAALDELEGDGEIRGAKGSRNSTLWEVTE